MTPYCAGQLFWPLTACKSVQPSDQLKQAGAQSLLSSKSVMTTLAGEEEVRVLPRCECNHGDLTSHSDSRNHGGSPVDLLFLGSIPAVWLYVLVKAT